MAKTKINKEELLFLLTKAFQDADDQKQQFNLKHDEAWNYYQGTMPKKAFDWECSAVPVLAMATDAIVPELINIFCSDENSAVRVVDAEGKMPKLIAQTLTDMINKVAMSDNAVKKFYNDLFLECLVFGDSFVKLYTEEKIKHEYSKEFEKLDMVVVDGIIAQLLQFGYSEADIHINQDKSEEETIKKSEREKLASLQGVPLSQIPKKRVLLTGSIKAQLKEKNIKIDQLPWEEVYVPSRLRGSLEEARYFCHKITISKQEALALGYSPKSVEAALDTNDEDPQAFNAGRLEPGKYAYNDYDTNDDNCDQVVLLEHYWRGVYDNEYEQLYKITTDKQCKQFMERYDDKTGKLRTDIEKIDYIPIVNGKCMTMPGQFYGQSLFDKLAPLQDMKTRIQRAILSTSERAANPSYMYMDKSVDRRSLENALRPGAAVKVNQPNAVVLFPHVDVPNSLYQLDDGVNKEIEMIVKGSAGKTDATEQMAGMSGSAIALLLNEDSTATMSMAYCLGETLFKPMFKIIMSMLQEHGKPLVIAGEAFDINMIQTDLDFVLDVATATDKATQATNLMNFLSTVIGQNGGALPSNITQENVVSIYQDYLQVALDTRNTDTWITPTDKLPKPSPEQQKVQAVMSIAQLKAQIAETELAEAKVSDMKADTENKLATAAKNYAEMKQTLEKIDIDKMNVVIDLKSKQADIELKKAEKHFNNAEAYNTIVETQLDVGAFAVDSMQVEQEMNINAYQMATGNNNVSYKPVSLGMS